MQESRNLNRRIQHKARDNAPDSSDAALAEATEPLPAVARASCAMNSSTLRLALSKVAVTPRPPAGLASLESKM